MSASITGFLACTSISATVSTVRGFSAEGSGGMSRLGSTFGTSTSSGSSCRLESYTRYAGPYGGVETTRYARANDSGTAAGVCG